ncbi:MAG: T9SS type A sorting domain-containing protein [Flavobacteriales bacterium]
MAAPNPADDRLTVSLPAGAGGNTVVRLFDATGRVVSTLRPAAGAFRAEIATAALAPGLYVLDMELGGTRRTERVVVKH